LAEYRLRSFLPWLASILLDAAMGGDVVQDPAQVIFIISKNPYSTKPTVGIEDCMISFFREAHCTKKKETETECHVGQRNECPCLIC
jgi:hypothetical protein